MMVSQLESITLSDYVFQPTINPFKNGIIVNYKKVGSRYVSHLLSMPYSESKSSLQLDFLLRVNPMTYGNIDNDIRKIKNGISQYYVNTAFDLIHDNQNEDFLIELKKFKEFKNTDDFLKYCKVSNFNDFFYNNPKDLYFLIRNPIERFISGTVQILMILLDELRNDEKSRDEIKFYTKLNDSELKYIVRNLNESTIRDINKLNSIPIEHLNLLLVYLFEKRWDMLLQDVHTENYLTYYKEWINGINDKSKVKIIDLKNLSTNKSKKLISSLRGDNSLFENEEFVNNFKKSNKNIYSHFLEKILIENTLFSKRSVFQHYIKSEMQFYHQLINSPYYVDLKD